jgi:hypothetical protein
MFNISTLKTALTGHIGFREFDDTTIGTVATALRSSVSGQYFDDFHPFLRTDNLYYAAPEEATFNTWLQSRVEGSIAKLFNRLATDKKLSGSTRSIFENKPIFSGIGEMSDTITKSGRLVGLAITPRNINNIQVVLNQIGFHFTSIQAGFNIYLWHSSHVGTVDSQVVTTSTVSNFDWKSLNFALDYVNYANDIDSGGTWFIGYFENDVTGNAIRKRYDFYNGPCQGCKGSGDNRNRFDLWSKYVDIMPFSVPASALSGTNLPALGSMIEDETTNFGMNISLTVRPDVTELITGNLSLITYPLGMQFANDMIEWMAYNPAVRINPQRVNASQGVLLYELSGATNTKADGIKLELTKAINALAEDLSDLSAALPKNKPSGIRIGAI